MARAPLPRRSCTHSHSAIRSPAQWQTLPLIGTQRFPADDLGPATAFEVRNCSCGSSLMVEVQS